MDTIVKGPWNHYPVRAINLSNYRNKCLDSHLTCSSKSAGRYLLSLLLWKGIHKGDTIVNEKFNFRDHPICS